TRIARNASPPPHWKSDGGGDQEYDYEQTDQRPLPHGHGSLLVSDGMPRGVNLGDRASHLQIVFCRRELGSGFFDIDFVPQYDVLTQHGHPVIGHRYEALGHCRLERHVIWFNDFDDPGY